METYLIIGAVVVGVIGLAAFYKYLKNKNIITTDEVNEVATVVTDVVSTAEKIMNELNLSAGTEKTIQEILDISEEVAEYVHKLSSVTAVADKVKLASDTIGEILDKLKVAVKDSDKNLIQIVVQESLKFLEGKQE